jgi:cysteine/histidine-rich domain-containing protein
MFPLQLHVPSLMSLLQVVDVSRSVASMLPTKLEVKLRKGEPGSWSKLDIPRQGAVQQDSQPPSAAMEQLIPEVDAVDLSDL